MRDLRLAATAMDTIHRHGESAYPEESCGFLIGASAPDGPGLPRTVGRVVPVENQVDALRTRRFVIRPEEVRSLEERLEGTGEQLLGFYHSHPDHPATPSSFDQDHAWPWYTYLILAVDHGRASALGAFELDPEERRFHPVRWALIDRPQDGDGPVTKPITLQSPQAPGGMR
jgi:proteasome lid subunit RPN8/RPN11